MANEAVKVELYGANNDGSPRRYTVASGASIAKGTLLTLTDPRTAAACTASCSMLAGIAAMDKDGSDYSTSISAWTDGIFEMVASAAIAIGDKVKAASETGFLNTVQTAGAGAEAGSSASGAAVLGYALEAADDAETINIRVKM